jgi:hypothetical protein
MWNRHARAAAAVLLLLAASAALAAGPADQPGAAGTRPFFEELLPSALRQPGPLGLLWWQWIGLPGLVCLAIGIGALLGLATRAALTRLAARTRTGWDDALIVRISGPLAALWAIAFLTASHPYLALGGAAESVLEKILRATTYLTLFWAGFRFMEIVEAAGASFAFPVREVRLENKGPGSRAPRSGGADRDRTDDL